MSITGLLTNILSAPNPKQVGPTNTTKTTTFTEKGKFHKANIRVCALKLTDLGSISTSPIGLFSAPVKPGSGPKQRKEDAKKQDYYLNLGYAIRSLREDFPEVFYKEPNFDIYRDDIIFKDPLNKLIVGIDKYKSVLWALRFHGRIFFKALWINVLSIYQPTEGVIMLRWTVHGIARLPWESHGRFDGTSEYKLDRDGKVYQHKVDNVAFNSPPKMFRVKGVEEFIQSLGGLSSTPKPTCFEISSNNTCTTRLVLSAAKFTPLREFSLSSEQWREELGTVEEV